MTRTGAVAHAWLASGGRLLPLLSVLLVSVSLAAAMNVAVTRSLSASDSGPSHGAAVVEGDEARRPGHTRYTFGPNSYCSVMLPRWCGTEFAGAQGITAGSNSGYTPSVRISFPESRGQATTR
jgi:hypothetical protein